MDAMPLPADKGQYFAPAEFVSTGRLRHNLSYWRAWRNAFTIAAWAK